MVTIKRRWAVVLGSGVWLAAIVVCGAAWAAEASAPAAADENPHVWKPRTHSVAVFKNGLGFFLREGEVKLRDGWCVAEQVPPAAFGTLAVFAHDEKEVVDIVGSGPGEVVEFDGRDAAKDVAVRKARLEAAQKLKIELRYEHKGQKRTAAGQLVSVGPEFVVLENDGSSFAVPLGGITRMQVLELPLRVHVTREKAAAAPAGSKLGMAYLRKGITWIPDYTLKVLDDDTAELTLRGTIVNEAEDLIHTDVHLVVGVPHFVHTGYLAPLAAGQVIRSMGAAVAAATPAAVTTQMMNTAAVFNNYKNGDVQFDRPGAETRPAPAPGGDLNRVLGDLPQLGGAAATDYTVYTKKDLTLRLGEKAIVTLFTRKINYSHVYRWSPPGEMEHSLVMHNQTDTAWTTGPCLALSAERPLSEDLLKYTPKGGRGELPVTAAINIAHDKSETETGRRLKDYSPDKEHTFFDLVTLEGTLKLRNYEKRPVTLIVANPIPGRPTSASSGGAISSDSNKLQLLERSGSVRWMLELKPGEEKVLTYQYERYVPSR
jgi:hypothetical protein